METECDKEGVASGGATEDDEASGDNSPTDDRQDAETASPVPQSSAELNQQQGRVTIVGRDKEKEMLGRLSWLLLDAGTFALKTTFDSIHPPLTLREHLRQSHVKAVLQRLLQQGMFTDKQWKLLYPLKKQQPSSAKYDSRTLVTLLETMCHLCPPYPNGWCKQPIAQDSSLSADVVRLQLFYEEIVRHETIPGEVYAVLFAQMRDVLLRLSGPQVRVKIARIETELINLTMQQHYIQTMRETWSGAFSKKLERIHEMKNKSSRVRRSYVDKKGAEEGLSAEDRVTLMRTHKLLVDSVPAEDVLDRLQQAQVIKFSDRQEILQVAKKADRMHLLLDKILKAQISYGLKALLEAMKFKYKKAHDHVVAVRKQVYKEGVVTTVDTVGITQDALASHYRGMFSKVYPFPWSDSICASIRDIYVPLDIVNSQGARLHSSELFPPTCSNGRGQRILLEGESGSGKSVLCAWLAYIWATQRHYFKTRYQQLLYLDASVLEGDIETAIYRALLPDNFKLSLEEFWAMIETYGSDVIVLLDGCDIRQNTEWSEFLAGTRLRQSTVLITTNPETQSLTTANKFVADTKWHILGFSEYSIKRCLKNCVTLSRQNHDHFEKLYFLADSHKWKIKPHLALPMLTVKTFAIFNTLRKGTMLKELKTVSDILDKYGVAMATRYCKKQKIDIIGFEFPDDILSTIVELDKFAYSCLLSDRTVFTEEEIIEETSSPMVLSFGAFSRFFPGSKLKFACGIPQHYLAAKHLADMAYEDMETAILQHKMIKLPKFMQMMSFLCGQYREDVDTQILPCIFDQLAARNEYCIRGLHLPATCLTPITPSVDGDVRTKIPRGVIQDFTTSLHCLTECAGRQDILPDVAQSLPPRLIIRLDSLLALKTVQGLVAALAHPDCAVAEVEIELHQFQCAHVTNYLQLADAIGQCPAIRAIKITWSSLDLMSKFLSAVTSHSQLLETVILIEDTSRKPVKQVTAATWAALQSACANMTRVTLLSFLNCRITAIVYHVLQHVPETLSSLNLTGCVLNLMCAGVIRGYLHGNGDIAFLDLSYTKLTSTEIVAIMQGMQLCDGIKHLRMRGALLDRPGVIALSEFLKLTHSLEVLDLSECELNTDMCTKLTAAIKQNRTLCKLVLNNTKVTSEGSHVIRHTKVDQIHVEGLAEIY